jgi:hypothetical protein
MRRILLAASVLAFCGAAAQASDDDVLKNYYGNTLISNAGMLEIHTHYKPDHTFDFSASMTLIHRSGTGTWKIEANGEICRDIKDPPAGVTNPSCGPIAPHKVGDSWTVTGKDGTVRMLKLVAGIQ